MKFGVTAETTAHKKKVTNNPHSCIQPTLFIPYMSETILEAWGESVKKKISFAHSEVTFWWEKKDNRQKQNKEIIRRVYCMYIKSVT